MRGAHIEPRAEARGNSIVTYYNSNSYNLSLTAMEAGGVINKL